MNKEKIREFQEVVWEYYRKYSRDLPWRNAELDGTFKPYKILVSEIMLQQTQAVRVVPKYHEFLTRFPSLHSLAEAPLADVLACWSGLGYNRRAKFLWQAAQYVEHECGGVFPDTIEELVMLPGVGKNTAGAIMAYAYNQPVAFIETNIRTAYIHHFFADHQAVADQTIEPFVFQTVDSENPREWYWALMDYGVFLKTTIGNVSRDSKHYTKQSKFIGSKRQVRGQVIKALTVHPYTAEELQQLVGDTRLSEVLQDLSDESLIQLTENLYHL